MLTILSVTPALAGVAASEAGNGGGATASAGTGGGAPLPSLSSSLLLVASSSDTCADDDAANADDDVGRCDATMRCGDTRGDGSADRGDIAYSALAANFVALRRIVSDITLVGGNFLPEYVAAFYVLFTKQISSTNASPNRTQQLSHSK
jgi:hypothetical protein